ncbi:unnamed protein product [Urochloa humidicola]
MPPSPSPCGAAITMTIGSYAEAKKLPNGRFIKSDPITAAGHSWRIALYPNGNLTRTNGIISLFLLMDDDDAAAQRKAAAAADIKFSFTIRKVGVGVGAGSLVLRTGKLSAAFSRQWNAHGFEHFLSRQCFENLALLKSDRLAIRCDLTIYPAGTQPGRPYGVTWMPWPARWSTQQAEPLLSTRTPAPPPPPPPPEPRLMRARSSPALGKHADLDRLLVTKEGADVEIEVSGGKVFAAHKTVLAARSPVFKEYFFSPAKEKETNFARIGDMRPDVFEVILHFMYTESLPEITMISSPKHKGATVLAEDLFVVADRYGMKSLKSMAEDKLCGHVGVSTVLLMLAFAEKHQCCKLKKVCIGFIGSGANAREIMASNDDVENLARSSPSIIRDVIMEILDTKEARSSPSVVGDVIMEILDTKEVRSRRLISICVYAFCFILPFLAFAVFKKQ